jgi:hypothetical protein
MGGNYKVHDSDGFRLHKIPTKFNKYRYRLLWQSKPVIFLRGRYGPL